MLMPDGVSFDGFVKFVKSRGDDSYEYTRYNNCAFAQYLKSLGYEEANVDPNFYSVVMKWQANKDYKLANIHRKLPLLLLENENFADLHRALVELETT